MQSAGHSVASCGSLTVGWFGASLQHLGSRGSLLSEAQTTSRSRVKEGTRTFSAPPTSLRSTTLGPAWSVRSSTLTERPSGSIDEDRSSSGCVLSNDVDYLQLVHSSMQERLRTDVMHLSACILF